MKLELDKTFDDYINAGEETVAEFIAENGPLVGPLRRYHDFYAKTLWSEGADLEPQRAFRASTELTISKSAGSQDFASAADAGLGAQ